MKLNAKNLESDLQKFPMLSDGGLKPRSLKFINNLETSEFIVLSESNYLVQANCAMVGIHNSNDLS